MNVIKRNGRMNRILVLIVAAAMFAGVFSMGLAVNRTSYAAEVYNRHTVSFDKNGGEGTAADIIVTRNQPYGKLPVVTKSGYTFEGWYTFENTLVTAATIVTATESHFLYAVWIKGDLLSSEVYDRQTVSFDKNGGEGTAAEIIVARGKAYGALPVVTKSGYTFSGWFSENNERVVSRTIVTMAQSHFLHARWSKGESGAYVELYNRQTVSFDKNGGEGTANDIVVTYGKPYGALPVVTKSGYTFGGWYTYDNQLAADVSIVTETQSHFLYARWTKGTVVAPAETYQIHTVSFNKGGGKGIAHGIIVTRGEAYGGLPVLTRSGYTFKGWFTKGGQRVVSSTIVTAEQSHFLYAKWSATSALSASNWLPWGGGGLAVGIIAAIVVLLIITKRKKTTA